MKIIWKEETRKLSDLKSYDKNPRYITKTAYQRLLISIEECGYNNRMLINLDNTIVGGHARLKALQELGYDEIKVLVPNRLLSEDEFKRILITDNLDFGDFDTEILANNFDVESLIEWGLPEEFLEGPQPVEEPSIDEPTEKEVCEKCPFNKGKKSFDLYEGN